MNKLHLLLFFSAVLIFSLRFYALGGLSPSILNRDEAALAYNSLLLNETGKDEWGVSWPWQLQSFGDYKLLGYNLFLILAFKVFGYSDWAVRLPSALAGLGLVAVFYLILRDILQIDKKLSQVCSFFFALTPVFFFYSRLAFEANVALFLFCLSFWLLFRIEGHNGSDSRFLQKREIVDFVALICLFLSCLTYNTPLLLTPFLAIALIYWRGIKLWRRWFLPVVGALVLFLFLLFKLSGATAQKSSITLFGDQTSYHNYVAYRSQFHNPLLLSTLGSSFVFYGLEISKRALASLAPFFVVLNGGSHPWHNLPNFGHIYLIFYLFFWLGLFTFIQDIWQGRNKLLLEPRVSVVLVFLLLVSLAPACITVDAPHATRSLFYFFLMMVIAAWGVNYIWKAKKIKSNLKPFILSLSCLLLVWESGLYFTTYFTKYSSYDLGLYKGFDQVISDLELRLGAENETKAAVLEGSGYQYVLAAWYLKMSPNLYFTTAVKQLPDRIGFRFGERVGRYRFIAQEQDRFDNEKYLIKWDERIGKWVVEKF